MDCRKPWSNRWLGLCARPQEIRIQYILCSNSGAGLNTVFASMNLLQEVPADVPQLQYARHVLSPADGVNQDSHYQPFAAAVDSAVDILISTAVATATSMGRLPAPTAAAARGNGSSSRTYSLSSSNYPEVQYGGSGGPAPAGAAAEAEGYYRPVLRQLCDAALRLHLQVQGTAEGMFLFVPGELLHTESQLHGSLGHSTMPGHDLPAGLCGVGPPSHRVCD